MKNTGTLATMPDGRNIIIYDNQPLLEQKGKVVVTLADEDFQPIRDQGGIKTLIFDVHIYNELAGTWKARGKCD